MTASASITDYMTTVVQKGQRGLRSSTNHLLRSKNKN